MASTFLLTVYKTSKKVIFVTECVEYCLHQQEG